MSGKRSKDPEKHIKISIKISEDKRKMGMLWMESIQPVEMKRVVGEDKILGILSL